MYMILKDFHMTFAALAIVGFMLRGYWAITGSALRLKRATKILPHINDALLFGSGIWLIIALNLPSTQQPWLLAKFAGLTGYIGFGMIAFRFGRSNEVRLLAFVAAVSSFAYIAGCALSKSPLSWLALI
jgi:uncharacterized membrane protein SirB2